MYAKLINGNLQPAPNPILHAGLWYGNPPGEIYEAEGYKPVVYTDPPETEPGFVAVHGYNDDGESLRQIWTVVPEPDEVDADRAMEILFGGESE